MGVVRVYVGGGADFLIVCFFHILEPKIREAEPPPAPPITPTMYKRGSATSLLQVPEDSGLNKFLAGYFSN